MSSLKERFFFNLKACPLVVTELLVVLNIVRRSLSFKSMNLLTILNTIVIQHSLHLSESAERQHLDYLDLQMKAGKAVL